MNKSPAFQWYPSDWFGSQRVQMLTLEEEGAYIRLIGSCWQHGSIPADPEALARLIGKGASTTLATTVATMFQPDPCDSSRLIHDRLNEERRKQDEWRVKSSKGGINSAKSRKSGKGGGKGAATTLQPPLQPNGNQQPTLLSSSSIEEEKTEGRVKNKAKAKSADEAESYAREIGCGAGQGEAFFDKMEGNGWTNAGKPVKDWRAVIRTWHRQGFMPVVINPSVPISQPEQPEFTYVAPPVPNADHYLRILRGEPDPDADKIVYVDQPVD